MVKFLIIRFSSIGDIVLTTPVIRHLKKQVEDAEVHFLTKQSYASLLDSNPYVDKVHSFDGDIKSCLHSLKQEGYDYIIDLHHNTRSARIKVGLKRMDFSVRKLNALKWIYVNFHLNRLPDVHMVDRNLDTIRIFIDQQDELGLDHFIPVQEQVDLSVLPSGFASGYLALAIGAQHETKKLPKESIVALCERLSLPVMILGGPGDHETGASIVKALPGKMIINGCGAYSIHQSASLVKQSRLLITHDTGLMHIGAALGKKIITIWGNTVPEFGMYPYRADPASLNFEVTGLRCRPCSKIGHQKCPKKHFKCMRNQDLDAIAISAERLFSMNT
jgi:ADP-heptose:LPS heptosyltransferase